MENCIKISIVIFLVSLVTIIVLLLNSKESYKNIESIYNKIKISPNLENTIETYKIQIKMIKQNIIKT